MEEIIGHYLQKAWLRLHVCMSKGQSESEEIYDAPADGAAFQTCKAVQGI